MQKTEILHKRKASISYVFLCLLHMDGGVRLRSVVCRSAVWGKLNVCSNRWLDVACRYVHLESFRSFVPNQDLVGCSNVF